MTLYINGGIIEKEGIADSWYLGVIQMTSFHGYAPAPKMESKPILIRVVAVLVVLVLAAGAGFFGIEKLFAGPVAFVSGEGVNAKCQTVEVPTPTGLRYQPCTEHANWRSYTREYVDPRLGK